MKIKTMKNKKNTSQNIQRNNFIWNAIAGLVNAAESVVVLMICTRTKGMEAAGILTIAFAVANLMMAIGKFGMRTYQVTDANSTFHASDYFTSRCITVGAMILVSIVWEGINVVSGMHSAYKALVVLLLCLIYAVESMEDVFIGVYQKKGRLDLGNKVFIVRWIGILLIFLIGFLLDWDILKVEVIALIGSIIVELAGLKLISFSFSIERVKLQFGRQWALFKNCMPLFVIAFLSLYITNAPKYAIDAHLSATVQASYGFIAMPVFVISLVNSFLYQPILVDMAVLWKNGKIAELKKVVLKQVRWIVLLTVVVLAGAFVLGIPFLNVLYHASLEEYKVPFMILMLGGGMLAVVGYEVVVLTIMRSQLQISIGYLAAAIIGMIGFEICTKYYGILGNVWFYDALMLALMIGFGVIIYVKMKLGKGKKDE